MMNVLAEKMVTDFEELPEEMQNEVLDFMYFLRQKLNTKKAYQGKKIRTILDEGSQQGVFSNIDNPVAWQREIRQDRVPGRE
jgi:hypothetical protein